MIDKFDGQYRFLSNFSTEGAVKPTVEHQFQALKSATVTGAIWVMSAATPGEAKRRGRTVDLREDWEDVKVDIMKELIEDKFINNKAARKKLLATGNEKLVEGNTWGDTFWGVCRGTGKNVLGEILMIVREELHEAP